MAHSLTERIQGTRGIPELRCKFISCSTCPPWPKPAVTDPQDRNVPIDLDLPCPGGARSPERKLMTPPVPRINVPGTVSSTPPAPNSPKSPKSPKSVPGTPCTPTPKGGSPVKRPGCPGPRAHGRCGIESCTSSVHVWNVHQKACCCFLGGLLDPYLHSGGTDSAIKLGAAAVQCLR